MPGRCTKLFAAIQNFVCIVKDEFFSEGKLMGTNMLIIII